MDIRPLQCLPLARHPLLPPCSTPLPAALSVPTFRLLPPECQADIPLCQHLHYIRTRALYPPQAASRCKADIPTGCLHGSCGVCEVELHRYKDAQGGPVDGGPVVVRACIAKVPRGWGRVEVGMMADDQVWGQDGWDT